MTGRSSATVVVGAIAAAATAGALVAIGHRLGSASAPFAAIASVPLPRGGRESLVALGVLLHVAMTFLWSAVSVRLAERLRSRVMTALVVAAAHFFVSGVVASTTGRGMASELTLGDRVIYALVLTVSLIVGMRYAFLHPRETATS